MSYPNPAGQLRRCGPRFNRAHFGLENLECRRLLSHEVEIIDLSKPFETLTYDIPWKGYEFEAAKGVRYSFAAEADDPHLSIVDDQGRELWTSTQREQNPDTDGTIAEGEWTAAASGTYHLLADASSAMWWIRAWAQIDDFGNGPAVSHPLTEQGIQGHLDGRADQDWFKFEGTSGQIISVVVVDHDLSLQFHILDAKLHELPPRNDTSELYAPEKMVTLPVDGTYYVRVQPSNDPSDGIPALYSMAFKAFPPDDFGDTPTDAFPLKLGVSVSGTNDYMTEEDWFSFVAEKGKTYRFSSLSPIKFAGLRLYDQDGQTPLEPLHSANLETLSDAYPFQTSFDWTASRDGTYYLLSYPSGRTASDIPHSSAYTLTVVQVPEAELVPGCDPLQLKGSSQRSLKQPGQMDWYRWSPVKGRQYLITTNHPQIEGLLKISFRNAAGEDLYYDTSYDKTYWLAPKDAAFVVISAVKPNETGAYSIKVEERGTQDDSSSTGAVAKHANRRKPARHHARKRKHIHHDRAPESSKFDRTNSLHAKL